MPYLHVIDNDRCKGCGLCVIVCPKKVLEISEQVYPNIANTTQQILDFNEKYDCEDHCNNLSSLDDDLSLLGEILADRILYEDQVIEALTVER